LSSATRRVTKSGGMGVRSRAPDRNEGVPDQHTAAHRGAFVHLGAVVQQHRHGVGVDGDLAFARRV
jgi:hypothetical protein